MGFEEDLAAVQASRQSEVAEAEQRDQLLVAEYERLVIDAQARLVAAARTLDRAGVPKASACPAHKARTNWNWPKGRLQEVGWALGCGDVLVVLRPDGWLAAVHTCSDKRQTLCACAFADAGGPVPRWVGLAEAGASSSEEVAEIEGSSQLIVRTRVDGELVDLPFNSWLANGVADVLAKVVAN